MNDGSFMYTVLACKKINRKDSLMAEKRIRNEQIRLRLTKEEEKVLDEKTSKAGLSRNEFLRRLILGERVYKRKEKDFKDYAYQVNRVGNNLNQLVKILRNKELTKKDLLEIEKTIDEIKSTQEWIEHDYKKDD